jgi:replicative DNA helicase
MSLLPALDLRASNDVEIAHVPSNLEAEQALLGALLYDNAAAEWCGDGLTPDHFYEPFHQRLYAEIVSDIRKGVLAEPILIAERFGRDPAFEELGGISYLADLVDRAPPAANARHYAEAVYDLALRRDLIRAADDLRGAAENDLGRSVLDIAAASCRAIEEVETGSAGDHWTDAGTAVREAIAHAANRSGLIEYPTGVAALDVFTGGLNAGEVTIIAARPGVGKTVAGLTVARACAQKGLGVCFFSLEMTRSALALRMACDVAYSRSAALYSGQTSNPTFDKAMKGDLDQHQWRRVAEAGEEIEGWPLKIDDRSGLNMAQIEAAVRRQHRRWRRDGVAPGPVIIDHLGKVRPPTDRRGARNAEVADVSNEAQSMAKRLKVPVLALVQLNRGVEGRDDKRPMLSDLRQAGELEEDARQVIFLYRPEYYVRDGAPDESFEDRAKRVEKLDACRNQMFWLIEKNSHGARGQVKSFCEIGCSAIREWNT